MKTFLKTILKVSIMILGIVISQNTTNGTAPAPQNNSAGVPPPQNNGTARPPPQNNGNGVMRNGTKPEGPSNLPPQKPAITDKLAAITDTRLVNLKNILQYLPPIEQDLIADCFNSNSDSTRLLTPDCYVGNFTETIRKPVSQGFSDALTNSSSANRDGLSCLQKMANTFGNSSDNTTNIITSDIATVITQQVPLNQATSNFVTTILNVLNSRRKFLLTTTNLILQSISSNDTLGFAEGFVFSESDQTTIVTSFKVYANFLYSFFSNLNSKVNSIQGMVGKLDLCKPPPAVVAATKRLLQSATTSSTTNPLQQGNNTGTNPPQQGNNNGPNPPPQGNNTGPNPPQQGNNTGTIPPQNQQPMGNLTMNSTGSNPPPQNQNSNGGKPQGKDGRPQNNIPLGITNLKSNVTALLATKTGSDWVYLNSEVTTNLDASSGYRPNGGLLTSILERITNYNPDMKYEFSKINRSNETCTSDYLFACKDGVCSCADIGCPTNMANVKQLTLSSGVVNAFNRQKLRYLQTASPVNNTAPPANNTNGQQPPPVDLSSDDFPSTYYLCSVCLSGKRYIFSEAKLSKSGLLIDFNDGKGNSLGKQVVDQQNSCAQGLKSGNSTAILKCRGSMSDDCSKKMDNACASTGLYDILINNPVPSSPLPTQCDDSLPTYTENNCFNWLVPKITKATIVFDYKGFLDLPRSIAISVSNGGSLNGTRRILQTNTITVVKVDPVSQSDPKAVIPSTVSQVSTTEVVVDKTTVAAAASPSTYINSLTQSAAQVTLSYSYLQYSFTIFTLALIGLLI